MKTLSQVIQDQGRDESKDIKKYMLSLKRRAQSVKGRNFPVFLGQSTAEYVREFCDVNKYKTT